MCCLGCAIFGITEVPTDGVDFDTGEISDSGTYSDTPTQPAAASPTPGGTAAYVPPPPSTQAGASAQTSTPDMEQGQAPTTDATPTTTIPEPSTETLPSQTTPADLLDVEQGQQPADNKDSAMQNSLHELD